MSLSLPTGMHFSSVKICFAMTVFQGLIEEPRNMQTTHHEWDPSLQQQKQPRCVWEDHLFGTFSARTGDREALLHRGEPPRVSSVGTWHQIKQRSEVEHVGVCVSVSAWGTCRDSAMLKCKPTGMPNYRNDLLSCYIANRSGGLQKELVLITGDKHFFLWKTKG